MSAEGSVDSFEKWIFLNGNEKLVKQIRFTFRMRLPRENKKKTQQEPPSLHSCLCDASSCECVANDNPENDIPSERVAMCANDVNIKSIQCL